MKAIFISKKKKAKVFSLWKKGKTKTEIEKETGICRKKVAQIIRINEHDQIFDVKRQTNWLVNE